MKTLTARFRSTFFHLEYVQKFVSQTDALYSFNRVSAIVIDIQSFKLGVCGMKFSRIFLMLLLVMLLVACGSNDSDAEQESTQESEQTTEANEESGIEVEKGLFNVEITLPPSLVGEAGIESFEESLQDSVDSDVVLNDDGSVTVTMSKDDHAKFLEEMKQDFITTIDDIVADEEFASIQNIEYNEDFSTIKLIVTDQDSFDNSFDGFATLSLGLIGMFYQAFDGKDVTKDKVTIEVFDQSTNETIHEILYPDALEELEQLEEE